MKIAVWHNLPSGGGKRALYEHVRGLKSRGHVIEAWCPSSADGDYLPLRDLVAEHVLPLKWEDPPSGGRIGSVMYPFRAVQSKLAAMERHCAACAEQIAARGFDLLFANSCMFFRAPAIGRMLPQMPRLLYLQEPYRWLYEALPRLPWLAPTSLAMSPIGLASFRRTLRDWVRLQGLRLQANEERANAQSFDRILVNSLFSRESVLRAYGLDAEVCYLGVSSEVFRPTGAARERFVVGLGSVSFEKGVDIAIRAIAEIATARRPALIWIANLVSRPYADEMQSFAERSGVDFTIRTRVSDEELTGLLSRAALMIYTSRLEPFGLAPLEANACGTPVVAVAEGGVRETIRNMHNGLLVPSRDPTALGHAVLALLDDALLAQQLGSRGSDDVRLQWGWDAAIDRLEVQLMSATTARLSGTQKALAMQRAPTSTSP